LRTFSHRHPSLMLRFVLFICLPSAIVSTAIRHSPAVEGQKVEGPLTPHFQAWLSANGYGADQFARTDYGTQGSYGGRQDDSDKVVKTPVVFIHGNTDSALAAGIYSGFTNNIAYFLDKGYSTSELYATSWGDVSMLNSSLRTHDCATTSRLRRFLLAVQAYTGADKLHIIGHSMGVTLGRKIVLGGNINANDGNCSIGVPLRFIDVFVGVSGANYGLCNCAAPFDAFAPTCNHNDGFWPGDSCGDNKVCGERTMKHPCDGVTYSKFLTDINQDFTQLAKRVVSTWSSVDDMIMYGDQTWGKPTSLIPRSTDQKIYPNLTHMQTKESDEAVADQYNFVNRLV
ncbi:hypothetical protein PRIPAC_72974, partial [Pristionchus pacificus]|uniref:Lipase n=1 Tax=Pristionchus pacificus TaxID=54126 RepID=A0A2A6C8G1_PRIPA